MHFLFVFAHFYPVLAIPAALGALQVAIHFKRRNRRTPMALLFVAAAFCILTSLGWVIFRGDLHSEAWARGFLEILSGPNRS